MTAQKTASTDLLLSGSPGGSQLVDLHCHSSASVGAVGLPTRIPGFLKQRGYCAFSLTEHDSLESLAVAEQAATEADIEFISGVELTTRIDDPELPAGAAHILGYSFEVTPDLEGLTDASVGPEWVEKLLRFLKHENVADIGLDEILDSIRRKGSRWFGDHY